jgi:hypothetical protein
LVERYLDKVDVGSSSLPRTTIQSNFIFKF